MYWYPKDFVVPDMGNSQYMPLDIADFKACCLLLQAGWSEQIENNDQCPGFAHSYKDYFCSQYQRLSSNCAECILLSIMELAIMSMLQWLTSWNEYVQTIMKIILQITIKFNDIHIEMICVPWLKFVHTEDSLLLSCNSVHQHTELSKLHNCQCPCPWGGLLAVNCFGGASWLTWQ